MIMINTCSKEMHKPFRDCCSYMVKPCQWSDEMPMCTTWDSPCFSNVDNPCFMSVLGFSVNVWSP